MVMLHSSAKQNPYIIKNFFGSSASRTSGAAGSGLGKEDERCVLKALVKDDSMLAEAHV